MRLKAHLHLNLMALQLTVIFSAVRGGRQGPPFVEGYIMHVN